MNIAALANAIHELMDARGWKPVDLAVASDIPKSTLSNILNRKVQVVELANLIKLAQAFDLPLRTILEASGIPVDTTRSAADIQTQINAYLEVAPHQRPMFEEILGLHPDDQASVLAFLESLRRQRR